jgi:hypothetical protein
VFVLVAVEVGEAVGDGELSAVDEALVGGRVGAAAVIDSSACTRDLTALQDRMIATRISAETRTNPGRLGVGGFFFGLGDKFLLAIVAWRFFRDPGPRPN